jgi:hypothetical protein
MNLLYIIIGISSGANGAHQGGSSFGQTLLMFLIILSVPLIWVIPIIIKTTRKKRAHASKIKKERDEQTG